MQQRYLQDGRDSDLPGLESTGDADIRPGAEGGVGCYPVPGDGGGGGDGSSGHGRLVSYTYLGTIHSVRKVDFSPYVV